MALLAYTAYSSLLPQIAEVVNRISALRRNQAQIEQAADWAGTIRRLKAANKQLLSRLNASYIRAPQNDELSPVLSLLSETAKETGVRFKAIQPQPVRDFPTYRVLPIEIELEGRFHAIARFLNGLERSKKIIKLETFELQTTDLVSTEINGTMRVGIFEVKGREKGDE